MYNTSALTSSEIVNNYHKVCNRIKVAAESIDRDYNEICLVVVTKTFDASVFIPLIDVGHKNFGENKVQEAEDKWVPILRDYHDVRLHLIGHLQSNKVKKAMELFYSIHTLDSPKRVNDVIKNMNNHNNKCTEYFIELNLGNELQKYGLEQNKLPNILDEKKYSDQIDFAGLMCIPPYEEAPSPYFALLKKIADKFELKGLSMGMSSDFEQAIQFGATHVRVGSEIFGSRS